MSKLSDTAKNISLRKVLAAVIAIVLVITVYTSTAFADSGKRYDVTVIDAGETLTVSTNLSQPLEILSNAGITVNSDDKVDVSAFTEGEGGEIVINRLNTVSIDFEGNIQAYEVYSTTVGDALNEIGVQLGEKDEVSYSSDAKVENGMVIKIKAALSVSLEADGKKAKYAITEGTVADLIKLAGVELAAADYTEPALDKKLKADMKVKVFRVEYKKEIRTEKIKFKTETKKDKKLSESKREVLTKGKNGSKDVTYNVKYVNGKEESKEKLSEVVTKEAVTEVVKVGTKKDAVKSNGVTSKGGFTVGQKISGRYTHYCACSTCNGSGSGVTSSGRRIRNGMSNPYYIACNWLPLGSVIKVKGHNYTVVDRGGSGLSRTGRIDIFTPEGHSACYRYGTGSCEIEIVRLGW